MKHPLVFPLLFVLLSFSIIYLSTGDANMVYVGILVVALVALLWNLFSINRDRKYIREKEKLYLAVIEHGQDALIVTDLKGCIKMANRQSEKLLGFVKNGLINHQIQEIIKTKHQDPKTDEMILENLLWENGDNSDLKTDALKKNGETLPVTISITKSNQSYIIVINDLSWQKTSSTYYDQYQIKHQMLKNIHNVMIWQYNVDNHEIRWETHNKNFFHLDFQHGHLNEFAHFIHPDDKSHFLKFLQETVDTGMEMDLEHRIVQTDGSIIWLRNQAILIQDRASPIIAGLAMNITDLKKHETQLNRCREILGQNQQGRYYFVGRIADQIEAPVKQIHKSLSGIKQTKDLDPVIAQQVKTAYRCTEEMQDLIGQMAELSDIQTVYQIPTAEPVDVGKVLQEVLKETDRKIRSSKVILDNQISSHSFLRNDPGLLKKILSNMIQSLIILNSKNGKLRLAHEHDGKYYTIKFIDTNDKLDTNDLENMLDAFKYMDRTKKLPNLEVGLKLAIVKSAVEKTHGTMIVESNPNFGNTISIQWPATQTNTHEHGATKPQIEILYLGDSANTVKLMENVVDEFWEANLMVSQNPDHAQLTIKKQPYDIIFLDADSAIFHPTDILAMIPYSDLQHRPQIIGISEASADQKLQENLNQPYDELWEKPLDCDLVRLKILEIKQQRND